MPAIYITGLYRMPELVQQLRPSHLVSIIQPEFQPPRPPEIAPQRHLRVAVHDIHLHHHDGVLAGAEDIERLLSFLREWRPAQGDLLVHCYAGVSRSTAVALLAHLVNTGDARASASALRCAVPYAQPNRRIVALADQSLELGGVLVAAVNDMTPPAPLPHEERLATLELEENSRLVGARDPGR